MNVTIDGKKVAVSDVYEVITNKEVQHMLDSGYADFEMTIKVYPDDEKHYHWKERMTIRRLQQFLWDKRFKGSLVQS